MSDFTYTILRKPIMSGLYSEMNDTWLLDLFRRFNLDSSSLSPEIFCCMGSPMHSDTVHNYAKYIKQRKSENKPSVYISFSYKIGETDSYSYDMVSYDVVLDYEATYKEYVQFDAVSTRKITDAIRAFQVEKDIGYLALGCSNTRFVVSSGNVEKSILVANFILTFQNEGKVREDSIHACDNCAYIMYGTPSYIYYACLAGATMPQRLSAPNNCPDWELRSYEQIRLAEALLRPKITIDNDYRSDPNES